MEIPEKLSPIIKEILQRHLRDGIVVDGEIGHLVETPAGQSAQHPAPPNPPTKRFTTFIEKSLPPEKE